MFKHHTIPIINTMSPNSTLNFDNFHLSYNRSRVNYGCDTTAIVLKGDVFLILNGNHKKELEEISNKDGLVGCLNYFIENIKLSNRLSEHHTFTVGVSDPFNLKQRATNTIGQYMVDSINEASKLPITSN